MRGRGKISRRDFVKVTAAAGAGLAASRFFFNISKLYGADFQKMGPVNGFIPNNRVAFIHDKAMTSGEVIRDWTGQNEATKADVVGQNMDRVACTLADDKAPAKAWGKILQKPKEKEWKDVVVAIKTNNIAEQHTRNAVMVKMCNVLVNGMGIAGANVHIFDGCHGGDIDRKSPFEGLPEGVLIEKQWGGINTNTPLPDPYGGETRCVKSITNDDVDILVNISMCKGHSGTFGGFTMTMKNHFGTFNPGGGHGKNGLGYLTSINKSEAVLGKIEAETGKIIKPKQQLCIIDALWSSQPGPGGPPTHCTNAIFMGTFPPMLDYIVARDFRKGEMGWNVNETATAQFLTDFGYTKEDAAVKMVSAG